MESGAKQLESELVRRVKTDDAFRDLLKEDPESAISEAAAALPKPLDTDVWVYRIVVLSLGIVIVSSVIGAIFLQANNNQVPELLLAMGSASVGALAGLLSPRKAE